MFELVKKIAGARRLLSTLVCTATLASVASMGAVGVASAVTYPVFNAPPSAPLNVASAAQDKAVVVEWNAPYYNGGGAQFFGYNVYMGTTANGESTTAVNGQSPVLPSSCTDPNTGISYSFCLTVPNLTDGTTYFFTVTAVNVIGTSAASNETSAMPQGPPGAPTAVTEVAGNGSVTITWTAPTSTGGSPILGYNVYCDTTSPSLCNTSFTNGTPVNPTLITALTYTVTGLHNGDAQIYDVVAVNALGEGASGVGNSVIPFGTANAPEEPYINSTNASWTSQVLSTYIQACINHPPQTKAFGGANWLSTGGLTILGYNYYIGTTPGGESTTPANGVSTPAGSCYTFTGLTPGTVYYFQIAAVTAGGVGTKSIELQRQADTTVPGPVTGLTGSPRDLGTGSNGSVHFKWNVPASNGGRSITGYRVYVCVGVACVPAYAFTTSSTSLNYGGLAPGDSVSLQVVAYNFNGYDLNNASPVVTQVNVAAVPNAPAFAEVTSPNSGPGMTTAELFWNNSTVTGNNAITGYNVYMGLTPGGESAVALNSPEFPGSGQWVTGLTPGTTYYFVMKAINAVGASVASNEISVVAGGYVPGAPTGLAITADVAGSGLLDSSWNAPSNGGDTIFNYQVCASATQGAEPTGFCFNLGNTTSNSFNPLIFFSTLQTVYVEVQAQNNYGFGAWSNEATYVVPTTPTAPTGLTAVNHAGNWIDVNSGFVSLSWTAATGLGTGGAAVTYQVYDVTDGCVVGYTTATTYTVTGWQVDPTGLNPGETCGPQAVLTFGSSTVFQVFAQNVMGWTTGSAGSNQVTVLSGTIPGRPWDTTWGVHAVTNNSALVIFNYGAPGSSSLGNDGGSPVTSFTATAWVGSTPWSSCTYVVGSPSNPYADGCYITGLPSLTRFTVTLQMTNALGTSYLDSDGLLSGQAPLYTSTSTLESIATVGNAPVMTATSIDASHVKVSWTDNSYSRNNWVESAYIFGSLSSGVSTATATHVCGTDDGFTGNTITYTSDTHGNYIGGSCTVNLYTFGGWTPGTPVYFAGVTEDNWYDNFPPGVASNVSNTVSITAVDLLPAAPFIDSWYNGDPNWQSLGNNSGFTRHDPYVCWDSVSGATGYNVYLGTAAGAESATAVNGVIPVAGPCLDLFYLSAGTTYYVVVKAVNGMGSSVASNEVSITPPVVPSWPINVMATAGDHQVTLNWDAPLVAGTSPFIGYYIYQGTAPGNEFNYPVNAVAVSGTSYTVTGLTNGVPYYFYVVAANAAGISAGSNAEEVSVTPMAKTATNTKLTLSPNKAKLHHINKVTIHVSVTGAAVSGTVKVMWTNRTVCTAVLVNGNGSCIAGANSVNKTGTRTLVATYLGDSNTLGSVGKATLKVTK